MQLRFNYCYLWYFEYSVNLCLLTQKYFERLMNLVNKKYYLCGVDGSRQLHISFRSDKCKQLISPSGYPAGLFCVRFFPGSFLAKADCWLNRIHPFHSYKLRTSASNDLNLSTCDLETKKKRGLTYLKDIQVKWRLGVKKGNLN